MIQLRLNKKIKIWKKLSHCRYNIICGIGIILVIIFLVWVFGPLWGKNKVQHGHIIIKDRNGVPMTDMAQKDGYSIPLRLRTKKGENIDLIESLIQIEDKRFYSHFGIDILAKMRAIWGNIYYHKTTGGSTLTEQWIKNRYFPESPRGISQKIREAFLSCFFSIIYDKETILSNYLNTVYLGNHIYGIQAASETYFHKNNLNSLTEEEITILITLIHNPSLDLRNQNYQKYFEQIKERLNYDFIPNITYLPKHENNDYFPFVTKKAIDICKNKNKDEVIFFSQYNCKNGDFTSTIDAKMSLFARETVRYSLAGLIDKNVTNAAVFALKPFSKEVLIYEGSRDFYSSAIDGQVNVIEAPRQPGSSMKPFLYLMALETGIHPDSLLIDTVQQYPSFEPGTTYTSENYTLKEYGLVRMKKALGNSLNNTSVRLAKIMGLKEVYDFYKSFGFQFDFPAEHYGYSLVLGNPNVTLKDLVISYVKLIPIPGQKEFASKFLLYDMLRLPDNRDISFGVNSILNTSILQAVKTGTSSNFRDNTIVSYSPDIVLGLWFGNNDNSSMIGVTGISGAGYAWHQIIEEFIRRGYIENKEVQTPDTLEKRPYCLDVNCFRQESTYRRKDTQYFSHIADRIYDHRDIPESPSATDIESLENLGFRIK